MKFERSSGILLHPTSLPGQYGIGDLGPQAYRWIEFLAGCGCKLWQVLPLGPTGYGDSPYQCFSAFAGNPYLISPELLLEEGLLRKEDLSDMPVFSSGKVDFGVIYNWKPDLLDRAYTRFKTQGSEETKDKFQLFQEDNADWLSDFSLFMALKDISGGRPWVDWDADLRSRQSGKLDEVRKLHSEKIEQHAFRQFLFFQQWDAVHDFARKNGIQIIGDIPIFVAMDSSDVWAHPELFHLDEDGHPTVVAGVPPDYFSPTGQLWGNPLYRWEVHHYSGYRWWQERFRAILRRVDIVRLDHFRGFAGYWEIPAGNSTAEKGRWVTGPGRNFFDVIMRELGALPIIAEDLGEITPDVIALRDQYDLPGMKILQFAFSGPDNPFLPHRYPMNCVAYTGTHDNDTAWGWYRTASANELEFARKYLKSDGDDFAWDLIRSIWSSVAVYAIAPMQDLLNLGNEARMNYPSKAAGNWTWRMEESALSTDLMLRMQDFNFLYER